MTDLNLAVDEFINVCRSAIIVLDAFIHPEDDQYDCFVDLKQLLFFLFNFKQNRALVSKLERISGESKV